MRMLKMIIMDFKGNTTTISKNWVSGKSKIRRSLRRLTPYGPLSRAVFQTACPWSKSPRQLEVLQKLVAREEPINQAWVLNHKLYRGNNRSSNFWLSHRVLVGEPHKLDQKPSYFKIKASITIVKLKIQVTPIRATVKIQLHRIYQKEMRILKIHSNRSMTRKTNLKLTSEWDPKEQSTRARRPSPYRSICKISIKRETVAALGSKKLWRRVAVSPRSPIGCLEPWAAIMRKRWSPILRDCLCLFRILMKIKHWGKIWIFKRIRETTLPIGLQSPKRVSRVWIKK